MRITRRSRPGSAPRSSPINRNVKLWIVGTSLSMFGDMALVLVIGVWIKDMTGSSSLAGLSFLAYILPRLAGPLTAILADRFRRRNLLLVINLVLAAVVATALPVRGEGAVWVLYVLLLCVGAGSALHSAAGSALLTVLVSRDDLGHANGVLRTTQEVGLLAAPAAGAALYVWLGPHAVLGIEVMTFLACALCLLAVRVDEPAPAAAPRRFVVELMAGVVHLLRTPLLRIIVIGFGSALLAFGFIETIIYALVDQGLSRPPSFVGVLGSVKGVASVLGGVLVTRLVRRLGPDGEGRITGLGVALLGTGTAVLIIPSLVAAVIGVFVVGAGIPIAIVGFYTAIQRHTPAAIIGRTSAAGSTLITTPQVVSVAGGAALAAVVDYRILLTVMAVILAASASYLLTGARAQAPPDGQPVSAPNDALATAD